VLISDDLGMSAIRDHYSFEDALRLAINAGVDIVLHANTNLHHADIAQRTARTIRTLVERDDVSEARIDEAYRRVQKLKARANCPPSSLSG
jgi:beta-N-acetylhexosaminidase